MPHLRLTLDRIRIMRELVLQHGPHTPTCTAIANTLGLTRFNVRATLVKMMGVGWVSVKKTPQWQTDQRLVVYSLTPLGRAEACAALDKIGAALPMMQPPAIRPAAAISLLGSST